MMDRSITELAKFVREEPAEQEFVVIRSMISDSFAIHEDTNIIDAAKEIAKYKISGAAVVDDNKRMIGFISEKDCLKILFLNSYNPTYTGSVAEYMSDRLLTVTEGDNMFSVIDLFIKHPFQAYPVLSKDGEFLGILRRSSVLKALIDKQKEIRSY